MLRIERYVFRTAATAFLAGLIALTGLVWVTQALRQIDLMTNKGQSLLVFFTITGLTLPSLVAIIAPVALFAGVLYCLNKLNGDSELVVMSASGVSPGRLLRPFLGLFALVFALEAALYVDVMPWSFNAIETLTTLVRADFIANFARPGAFNELESGFIFHFRDRAPDGSLRGVFMQDRRDPAHIITYISEVGKTAEKDGQTYLVLSKGTYQRPERSGNSAIVTFEDYAIDLSQFIRKGDTTKRPRERATLQLIAPDPKDASARVWPGDCAPNCSIVSPARSTPSRRASSVSRRSAKRERPAKAGASRRRSRFLSFQRCACSASPRPRSPSASRTRRFSFGRSRSALRRLSVDAIFAGPLSRALQGMRRLAFAATRKP